jgi:uncharacterized protein
VLKVHSRCDLACDHCYVYEHLDQSWRGRPRVIARETVRAAAARIAEHSVAHGLSRVRVVLHGGEPLLAGLPMLRDIVGDLRTAIDPVAGLDLRMQTNGLRLSEAMCDLFREFGVHVGVSMDGDREANDRHRRFADGASSHDDVLRALAMLRRPEYRAIYAGILCTVDVRNDPDRVYEALLEQEPPRVDLLLPHATWDRPPPRPDGDPSGYGTWLLRVFQRWVADGRPMPIRLFDALRSSATGGPSGTEWVGLDRADLVVIETDGSFEQVDSLKIAYEGAPATGFDVFSHAVDTVAALPQIARRQRGLADLCPTCRACPVVRQCGGGLFAHRYRGPAAGSGDPGGFDNPSVYCSDLKTLIHGINRHPHRGQTRPATAPTAPTAQARPHLDDLLDQIGTGCGDEATVAYLAGSQLAITRALLAAVAHRSDSAPAGEAWHALADLDRAAPEAVRSVLSHPYLRAWAVGQLGRPTPADASYLGCVAAAAAIRAGVGADLPVMIRDGLVHLPTVGTIHLPHATTGLATLSTEPWPPTPDGSWRPARHLTMDGRAVLLEDADPHRDCHQWTAAERLTDDAVHGWQRVADQAWLSIEMDCPDQVPGLRTGLRALTPLEPDGPGLVHSATARHAFGAIGTTLAQPDELAVVLVHEFQHSKLGALLDLCDLFDRGYRPRLTVGWRDDPRPLEGVLQGTYAHLAVAQIWRGRAERAVPRAAEHYRRYRDWTAAAIDALAGTGALTPAGHRLVRRMAESLAARST